MLQWTGRLQRVVVIASAAIAFGLGGVVGQSVAQDNMKKDDKMKMDDKMKSGDTMMKDDKKGGVKAGEMKKDDRMMPGDKTMEKK